MQYDFPDVEKARQKKVDPMIAEIWNIVYNDDPIWKKNFFFWYITKQLCTQYILLVKYGQKISLSSDFSIYFVQLVVKNMKHLKLVCNKKQSVIPVRKPK